MQPGVFGLVSSVHFAVNYRIQKLLFWRVGEFPSLLGYVFVCRPAIRIAGWTFDCFKSDRVFYVLP